MRNKGLLLDRDGVINTDHGYVGKREQFEFLPGLFPFLRAARDQGYKLAILTNQSGVGRGHYSEQDFHDLMQWVQKTFTSEGISIDLILASFEHPEATDPAYRRESFWRKPKPGMVLEAIQRLQLDSTRSAMLGDKLTDMQAAQAGGIKKCLWLTKETTAPQGVTIVRDYTAALKAVSA